MALIARFTDSHDDLTAMVAGARYETVTFSEPWRSNRVGQVFRIPAALLIAALGLVCLIWAPPSRYRRQLHLTGWRGAVRFLSRRCRQHRAPPQAGPMREADPCRRSTFHVQEWVARYATNQRGGYDAEAARGALIRQLGPVWRGPQRARPFARVMFAAFALDLADPRDQALGLLGDLAEALAAVTATGRQGGTRSWRSRRRSFRRQTPFSASPSWSGRRSWWRSGTPSR